MACSKAASARSGGALSWHYPKGSPRPPSRAAARPGCPGGWGAGWGPGAPRAYITDRQGRHVQHCAISSASARAVHR